MRQFLSVCITTVAIAFSTKKKYIIAIALILLASTIHASALIMLPGIFIIQGKAWNKKTILALLAYFYVYGAINNVTIENISLDIRKGENIALIGISGSGKSTLIKVILGALQVQKGAVYMNGVNINDLSRKQIYSWFSIVTQTPMCLNGSIRKNVDIAGQFTDEEIWKALELAEVKDDVMGMPLKLDTVIGEDG